MSDTEDSDVRSYTSWDYQYDDLSLALGGHLVLFDDLFWIDDVRIMLVEVLWVAQMLGYCRWECETDPDRSIQLTWDSGAFIKCETLDDVRLNVTMRGHGGTTKEYIIRLIKNSLRTHDLNEVVDIMRELLKEDGLTLALQRKFPHIDWTKRAY